MLVREETISVVGSSGRKKSIPPKRPIGPKKQLIGGSMEQGNAMNLEERAAGNALSIEQMAGGSGQPDVSNDDATIVTGDVLNVYSDVVNEIVEFRHEMDDEYVSDDLESLSGSDGEGDVNRVSESPPANYIQSIKDVQKVMGLARQVISGEQPDWNVVTKEMPISPDLLHTYNTVQQLSHFARTLTGGEGGKSHEDGGTKPTDPFIPPPQSDGATDGVIPTQTSGTDTRFLLYKSHMGPCFYAAYGQKFNNH
ncbi:conjugal transfer protein TraY [Sesbania bispinosa]|nr:conjugal transfer protein TraY [Sesbania bispinosa]